MSTPLSAKEVPWPHHMLRLRPTAPPRPKHGGRLTEEAAETRVGDSRATASKNRRPDIQGLRAIAVILVVAFHAGLPVPGGFIGVDVFFVISGFVITGMLHREWTATGRLRFDQFYLRRFKRLTPALALMVAVTMLLSVFLLSPFGAQQTAAETGIGAMLLVANFVIARTTGGYFDASAESNPLLNTWSLSVEEQFYLVFPALIVLGWYLAGRRSLMRLSPYAIVGGIAIVSFALAVIGSLGLTFRGSGIILGFYSPFARAWEFAVGALLALVLTRHAPQSPRLMALSGLLGALLLAAGLWAITDSTPFPGPWTLLPVTATLLLLLAGTEPSTPTARLLSTRPAVKVGDWSYAIYLWHWPTIVLALAIWPGNDAVVLAAAGISIVPAILSYRWVEQPIRAMSFRSRVGLMRLLVITLLIPMALAGLLFVGARAAWWMAWPMATTAREDHVALGNCVDKPFDPNACTWNRDQLGGQVLVAGDSQAYAVADGVIEAAKNLLMSTVVTSRSGCPLSSIDTTGDKPLDCPSWQRQVLDFALATRPQVVVIANRSTGYTNPGSWRTMAGPNGVATTQAGAVALYEQGLASVAEELTNAGIGLVIIQNIPEPPQIALEASILRRVMPTDTQGTFDPSETIAQRDSAATSEETVAETYPGTVLLDPSATFCESGRCKLTTSGGPVFLDPWHLSRGGALLLVPPITDAIRQAKAVVQSVKQFP